MKICNRHKISMRLRNIDELLLVDKYLSEKWRDILFVSPDKSKYISTCLLRI